MDLKKQGQSRNWNILQLKSQSKKSIPDLYVSPPAKRATFTSVKSKLSSLKKFSVIPDTNSPSRDILSSQQPTPSLCNNHSSPIIFFHTQTSQPLCSLCLQQKYHLTPATQPNTLTKPSIQTIKNSIQVSVINITSLAISLRKIINVCRFSYELMKQYQTKYMEQIQNISQILISEIVTKSKISKLRVKIGMDEMFGMYKDREVRAEEVLRNWVVVEDGIERLEEEMESQKMKKVLEELRKVESSMMMQMRRKVEVFDLEGFSGFQEINLRSFKESIDRIFDSTFLKGMNTTPERQNIDDFNQEQQYLNKYTPNGKQNQLFTQSSRKSNKKSTLRN